MVHILDRFERSFERLMEGSIGRVFNSPIQPAEIGRKLERAMLDHRVASTNAILAPNDFRVAMHPSDMLQFVDYINGLNRQMESWLSEVAAQHGLTLVDRVRVQIDGDERVSRRSIAVRATIADRPEINAQAQQQVQQTEIYRVVECETGSPPHRLRILSGARAGEEIIIRNPVTTIGRSLDNDLVLQSHDVSRHHARIERSGTQLVVSDLASTNGTQVNSQPVHSHLIQPGDELTFGTVRVQFLALDRWNVPGHSIHA